MISCGSHKEAMGEGKMVLVALETPRMLMKKVKIVMFLLKSN